MSKVGIIMGSNSDMPVMQDAIAVLHELNIETEIDIKFNIDRTPTHMLSMRKFDIYHSCLR